MRLGLFWFFLRNVTGGNWVFARQKREYLFCSIRTNLTPASSRTWGEANMVLARCKSIFQIFWFLPWTFWRIDTKSTEQSKKCPWISHSNIRSHCAANIFYESIEKREISHNTKSFWMFLLQSRFLLYRCTVTVEATVLPKMWTNFSSLFFICFIWDNSQRSLFCHTFLSSTF